MRIVVATKREYVLNAYKDVNGDLGKPAKMIPVHRAGLPRFLDKLGLPHLKRGGCGAA